MTQPSKEAIAWVVRETCWWGFGLDGKLAMLGVDDAARAILALFPDATHQAERIAELERKLATEREITANLTWAIEQLQSPTDCYLLKKALVDVAASLAAAISLLERGGKAAKKAAPSDRMFDQMVIDYRASLERARAALASAQSSTTGASDE